MIRLGGELTLRETVHQVEALRQADEIALDAMDFAAKVACYAMGFHRPTLTADFFDTIANPRHPQRISLLASEDHGCQVIGAEVELRRMLAAPQGDPTGMDGHRLRRLVKVSLGHEASIASMQQAIVRRRAAFHPDKANRVAQQCGINAYVGYCAAYDMFDAMAQALEKPHCQRALFPRGERWVGPYTREAAVRDLRLAAPVLGYLAAMTIVAAFHFLSLMAQSVASDLTRGYVWLGLQLPNQGAGNPQVLALPAA